MRVVIKSAFLAAVMMTAGVVQADEIADCFNAMHAGDTVIDRVDEIPFRGTVGDLSVEDVDKRVAAAEAAWAKASRCIQQQEIRSSKKYPKLKNLFDKLGTEWEQKKIFVQRFRGQHALRREAAALTKSIEQSDGSNFDALFEKAKALEVKIEKAQKDNPLVEEDWQKRTFQIVGSALGKLKRARKQAEVEAHAQRLRDGAVTSRLARFKPEDAYDPQKIAEAFVTTDPKYYLATLPSRYKVHDSDRMHRYRPGADDHYWSPPYRMDPNPKQPVVLVTNDEDTSIFYRYRQAPADLPTGVPGLLWHVVSPMQVVFVTLDGGRYESHLYGATDYISKTELWPKDLIHADLLEEDVLSLGKSGVLPAKFGQAMKKASETFTRCSEKIWDANQRRFDRIREANILPHARDATLDRLDAQVRKTIDKKCKRQKSAYQKNWKAASKSYKKNRRAAFAKMKKHLHSLITKARAER